MDNAEFRQYGHQLIDWIAEYYQTIESLPVKSRVAPGEVKASLPMEPPAVSESFDRILADFDQKIMPGITHWQHPSFFAYFNANTSFPSILGELLTSAIGAQCMIWETSPAAAELEELMCDWIKSAFGLPAAWHGVIQDTASTATLCALLMAREKHSNFMINKYGFHAGSKYIIYCSSETHSSIEKGMKIAGFGSNQLRKIRVDDKFSMIPEAFERQVIDDLNDGFIPLCVVSAVGTTSSHGMDPVRRLSEIASKYEMFHHVDAAHAGNATVLEECRWLIDGLELADSYVFNPHKWMFTNFDCSLFYVKEKGTLIRTFEILPEYLKTGHDSVVNNYRDWGIQLGRRFRALKLWLALRSYGLEGICAKFRDHIELAKYFQEQIGQHDNFEIMAPRPLNLVCFRYKPKGETDESKIEAMNRQLKDAINSGGEAYITHTLLHGKYTLRACIGQTNVEKRHVDQLLELLISTAGKIH